VSTSLRGRAAPYRVGHRSGSSQTRARGSIFFLRDWWPVLAAFALCPLMASLAPDDPAEPLHRAAALRTLESGLGTHFEPAAVAWLSARPALHAAAGFFYLWVHLPATVGVLVWVWLERRRAFGSVRNAFLLTQGTTVAINALLPTAPPLMDGGEAARAAGGSEVAYVLQSPFAAMPSGHVAFATFVSGTLIVLVRKWPLRVAAGGYLALVVAIVIATGNHFCLDAAAGAAIAAIALRATA
jgi:membrane-associated phospholipid phosphatase